MRRRLIRDAEQWESGTLGLREFDARHPRADVPGLVRLLERLQAAAPPLDADPDSGWATLQEKLTERPEKPSRAARRVRRTLAGAFAILLVGTSIAYAASEPVRHGVNRIVRTVSDVFTGVDEQGPTGDQGDVRKDDDSNDRGDADHGTSGDQGNSGDGDDTTAGPEDGDSGTNGNVGSDEGESGANEGELEGTGSNDDPTQRSGSGTGE
jgi:hypothetical protein